jgi:hypothetical protein
LHCEPQAEAVILRSLRADLNECGEYIDPHTRQKLEKVINTRLLTILNDAAPK